jgi:hypothetical protein
MSAPNTDAPVLGRFERTCSQCGREWLMTQAECVCGSHELVEKYAEPKLLERGPLGAIRALVIPAKPKAPRATAAPSAALRGFRASVENFSRELASIDETLRRAVRDDGIEELQGAQATVNLAVSTIGDASPSRIVGLSLALRSLHVALNGAIDHLEDDSK